MAKRFATGPLARADLLGGFVLTAQDDRLIAVVGRRARALLAVLCLEGGSGVPRERICGLLWGDRAEDQARASLRQCLFELKGHLGELGDDLLEIGRERIALKPGMLDSDVEQIRRALGSDDADALAAVAPRLGRGELLEGLEIAGLFQDWLEQARSAFEAALARDVVGCLTRLQAKARWEEVITLADGYLRRDPLQEGLVAAAIRAERAIGRNAAAQKRFEAISQRLTKELGVSVSSELLEAARGEQPPAASRSLSGAAPGAAHSQAEPILAVLPFENLSADADTGYFSDGVSEEILGAVAHVLGVKVIGRASSFQFRGADKSTQKIAVELGASHILDGSVRRAGDRLRIAAQLVECATHTNLWSKRFDGDLSDVFALQDKIAAGVAAALELVFAPGAHRAKVDAAAYDLYLRALSIAGAPHSNAECLALLERAVVIAPDFAPAWGNLALARVMHARYAAAPDSYAENRAWVLKAAETAVNLDAECGPALTALSLLQPVGAYGERKLLLERALSAAPDDAQTHKYYADFLQSIGRMDERLAAISKARDLDPLNRVIANNYAEALADVGRVAEAYQAFAAARERWPDFDWLVSTPLSIAALRGDWDVVETLLPLAGGSESAAMALRAVAVLKAPTALRRPQLIAAAERQLSRTGTVDLSLALFMHRCGLADEAFEVIGRASFDHIFSSLRPADSYFVTGVIFGAAYAQARDAPRFLDLCAKLKLCDYWIETDRWPDCAQEIRAYDFKDCARRCAARMQKEGLGS